jgi:hypothetical protein
MHKDTLEKPIAASSSSNSQKSKKRDRAGEGAGSEDLEAGLHTADDGKNEKKVKYERLNPEEGVEETQSQEEDMTDMDDSRQVSGKDVSVMQYLAISYSISYFYCFVNGMRRKLSTEQQTLTNRTGRKTKNQQLRYQG